MNNPQSWKNFTRVLNAFISLVSANDVCDRSEVGGLTGTDLDAAGWAAGEGARAGLCSLSLWERAGVRAAPGCHHCCSLRSSMACCCAAGLRFFRSATHLVTVASPLGESAR